MEIRVKIKNVYGVDKIYPACDKAQAFVMLANKLTLSRRDVDIIKGLGYTVRVTKEEVTTL